MQPKCICFFNSNKAWGGGEKWHFENALLARDKGYRVCVVANRVSALADRLDVQPGIDVLRLNIHNLTFLNPLKLMRLVCFFRKHAVNAVLMALPSDMKAGGIAAKLAGVRDIIYRRGIAVPVRNSALNRLLFRHVLTKLIVNSLNTRDCVLAENKRLIDPERIHLVFCGFNVAAYDALPVHTIFERRPGEILIGNAARLTPQKGQKLLIDIAALLKEQPIPFRILIAGIGELEKELKAYAIDRGVEDVVQFLGFVSDMKSFHETIDIFALTSLWEGFGLAQVEAMESRRPVVTWNVSSMPEVVIDGETGYLCPSQDTEAFAARLLALMQDEALRKRLGENGRARVISHFEMQKTFADLEHCLQA
ncbi:MAG: group 1 glycosyl transferase [Desulfovibrionales bacterium GWA2_65_9]|nr:MAG: group 1 glycosyl transferase [Desulfovibrionales bacterium GWA2_65_9]